MVVLNWDLTLFIPLQAPVEHKISHSRYGICAKSYQLHSKYKY